MKLVFSESAVNFPSIGTSICKKKVFASRRKTMKGVNVLTEGKAKNGRLGHSHCGGRFCKSRKLISKIGIGHLILTIFNVFGPNLNSKDAKMSDLWLPEVAQL